MAVWAVVDWIGMSGQAVVAFRLGFLLVLDIGLLLVHALAPLLHNLVPTI